MPVLEQTPGGGWRPAVPLPYYVPEISRRWSIKKCHCRRRFFRHSSYERHYRMVHAYT